MTLSSWALPITSSVAAMGDPLQCVELSGSDAGVGWRRLGLELRAKLCDTF